MELNEIATLWIFKQFSTTESGFIFLPNLSWTFLTKVFSLTPKRWKLEMNLASKVTIKDCSTLIFWIFHQKIVSNSGQQQCSEKRDWLDWTRLQLHLRLDISICKRSHRPLSLYLESLLIIIVTFIILISSNRLVLVKSRKLSTFNTGLWLLWRHGQYQKIILRLPAKFWVSCWYDQRLSKVLSV